MGLWTETAVARLERLGDDLRERANLALDESGVAFKVTGQGSLFRIMPKQSSGDFRSGVPDDRQQVQRRELHLRMLGQGVLTSPTGLGCLSTVMGEDEVAEMVEGIRVAASAVTS